MESSIRNLPMAGKATGSGKSVTTLAESLRTINVNYLNPTLPLRPPGLGLAMAKRVLDAHDIRIIIGSEEKKGSTVTMRSLIVTE